MPYYQEWIINKSTANWSRMVAATSLEQSVGIANVDMVRLLTHRGKPREGLLEVAEVPDNLADPYTTFMGVNRIKRDAALAREFSSDLFVEDRGHAFELLRFKSFGSLWTGSIYRNLGSFVVDMRGANLDFGAESTSWPIRPGFAPVGWSNLEAYAQAIYAKAAPTPNKFDLGTFMGELREGLPRLVSEIAVKGKTFKAIGSDYLNVEFGWKPFLSDLIATGEALMGATTALLGPRGPLHRTRREDEVLSSSSSRHVGVDVYPVVYPLAFSANAQETQPFYNKAVGPAIVRPLSNGNVRLFGDVTMTSGSRTERWFEGSYTFIPRIGFNPDSFIDRFAELSSPNITPADLWALAPWSWLIDWAVKIGDTIAANEVASDNRIISNYAYAMESVQRAVTMNVTNLQAPAGLYAGPTSLVRTWETSGKRRIRANPYGFKPMTTAGLNTNQWMIMAALGLTKAGR